MYYFDRYLNSNFFLFETHTTLLHLFYTMFIQIYPLQLSIWDYFQSAEVDALEFPLEGVCC